MPEGLDGIEPRGVPGGEGTGEDPDGQSDPEGEEEPLRRSMKGSLRSPEASRAWRS